MFETSTIAIVVGTFLLAGGVKGIIGLGLPTISLGVLAAALDLPTAIAVLIVPSIVTNIWQAGVGGHAKVILQRIWPFLLLATAAIWFGSIALTAADPLLLLLLLGLLLVLYASFNLLGFRFTLSLRYEPWVGLAAGFANGVLAGMTGSFVVPGVMYLQAIGLQRDRLVQAMGMLFSLSTIGLAVALGKNDLLTTEHAALSTIAVLPAIIGMVIGQRVRKSFSELYFRNVFFTAILALGVLIIIKSLSSRLL